MTTSISRPPVQFGHVHYTQGANREVPFIITQGYADSFQEMLTKADEMDTMLSAAGIDTSENSKQSRIAIRWPHQQINITVADEETKDRVAAKLDGPLNRRIPMKHSFQGEPVSLLTEDERKADDAATVNIPGLPIASMLITAALHLKNKIQKSREKNNAE